MTPLEEIEQAIERMTNRIGTASEPSASGQILAALYTARAIERLEATVRMIGIDLQRITACVSDYETGHGTMQVFNTWNNRSDSPSSRTENPAEAANRERDWTTTPHAFKAYAPEYNGSPCRCGNPRVDPIHPAESL